MAAEAGSPPPIRSSDANAVPACVTPDRMMSFIGERNARLEPRYKDIASFYKRFGEQWHVRWDYAIFQMILETNYLTYRQGNGRRGDVWESQNNFAGIGATGRGARGESFADVETGVHAQIQHLVAYSGEMLDEPVAKRTRENQDEIVRISLRLGRTVTFADLTRRWATDRAYGKSIEFVADLFRSRYCTGKEEPAEVAIVPVSEPSGAKDPTKVAFRPPSGLGGPKPNKLGAPAAEESGNGPEVFPWGKQDRATANSEGENAPQDEPDVKPAKSAPPVKPTSVRTIWKRGDGAKSLAAPSAPPADGLNDASSAAPSSADEPSGTPTEGGETPSLPTFHVAPLASAPSKLGGPVPPLEATTAEVSAPGSNCHILTASYGGTKTLLLKSSVGGETNLMVLTVLDGFEKSMVATYAKQTGSTAELVGEYPSKNAALAEARGNCPNG